MHQHVLHAGSFLVVPCGQYKQTADSPTLFTAYVYARGHWAQPFLRLPATNKVNPANVLLDVSSQSVPSLANPTNVGKCNSSYHCKDSHHGSSHRQNSQSRLTTQSCNSSSLIHHRKVCCKSDCNRKAAIQINPCLRTATVNSLHCTGAQAQCCDVAF